MDVLTFAAGFPAFVGILRVVGLFADKFQPFGIALFEGTVETGLMACVALAAPGCYFED